MIWWPRKSPTPSPVAKPEPDGLPVLSFEQLVERTQTARQLNAIRLQCGFTVEFHEAEIAPMLRALAEHVQLLPSVGSDELGSLWVKSLNRAVVALSRRRGRILPPGAAPEQVGALAHRWTAAVLWGALLDGMGAALCHREVFAVAWSDTARLWQPLGSSLVESGVEQYQIGTSITRNGDVCSAVGILLFGRWASPQVVAWMSDDEELWGLFCDRLSGRSRGGVLGELIGDGPDSAAQALPPTGGLPEAALVDAIPVPSPSTPPSPEGPPDESLEEFEERQRQGRARRNSDRGTT